jgi:DNA-binding MarR family transcriptional regulator
MLAEACGMDRHTVKAAVEALEARGWLSASVRAAAGARKLYTYTLDRATLEAEVATRGSSGATAPPVEAETPPVEAQAPRDGSSGATAEAAEAPRDGSSSATERTTQRTAPENNPPEQPQGPRARGAASAPEPRGVGEGNGRVGGRPGRLPNGHRPGPLYLIVPGETVPELEELARPARMALGP